MFLCDLDALGKRHMAARRIQLVAMRAEVFFGDKIVQHRGLAAARALHFVLPFDIDHAPAGRVFHLVQEDALKGEGVVISLTDCYRETDYGEPMSALKSYILSPFAEEQYVDAVLQSLWKARAKIAAETKSP